MLHDITKPEDVVQHALPSPSPLQFVDADSWPAGYAWRFVSPHKTDHTSHHHHPNAAPAMRYSDYIPLATTPSAARTHFDHEPHPDAVRPNRGRWRRPLVLGTGLVIILAALYVIIADLLDDAEDLFGDDSDYFPEYHAAYLPFEPPKHDPSAPAVRLTPTQVLPDHCRDAYFSSGAVCYDPEMPLMDVVWTWVNGSDPLLQAAKLDAESRFDDDDPYRPKTSAAAARQYRCVEPPLATRPAEPFLICRSRKGQRRTASLDAIRPVQLPLPHRPLPSDHLRLCHPGQHTKPLNS